MAVDAAGNVYIAAHNRIRKVDATTGTISTTAGGGNVDHFMAFFGKLSRPRDVAVDDFGNVYIADYGNNRIRRVSAFTRAISTIAGTGEGGNSGDGGLATEARLGEPQGIATDAVGNVYIADTFNHRIRKVDAATGTISTIAGTGGRFGHGYSGDGGPAIEARLRFPEGVAVDVAGNVYIADTFNGRIRKVNAATGTINTIAGGERFDHGNSGDGGPATEARLRSPKGVALDVAGNLYIADTLNFSIRRVDVCTGTISTIAGTGEIGNSGDGGPATEARLGSLTGVAMDGDGNVYIADDLNHRIRVLKPRSVLEPGGCPSAPSAER